MDDGPDRDFDDALEPWDEAEEVRPRGYSGWARRAAAAFTGLRHDSVYEAEEVLLERLRPGWAARIVAEQEQEEFSEDPAEIARHTVWALHRGVGFARETLQLVVDVEPRDADGGMADKLVEPRTAKVHAYTPASDDPDAGFVLTPTGIFTDDQQLLAEKEEPLSAYECRSRYDLQRLHEKIYRWLPKTAEQKRRAKKEAKRLSPLVEELQAGAEALEDSAAEMDLEDEVDAVRGALSDLYMDLEEVWFDEEEQKRFTEGL